MQSLISWLKSNKLSVILLVFIVYLLSKSFIGSFFGINVFNSPTMSRQSLEGAPATDMAMGISAGKSFTPLPPIAEAPPTDVEDRLVIRDTSLSLQVVSVNQTLTAIESIAEGSGGYLVNSNLSVPQDAASGSITIRVPETKRAETLSAIKELGIKTVSENVSGRDVTDQYVDIEARLATLTETKAKFEEIFDQAIRIQDILDVQREIISLQNQIDSLKGQQLYLEQSAKLTKITVYLSTDEYALPYTPSESWRPEVIFKQAVRSLVKNARNIGTAFIWMAVYTPVWLTALIIYWLYRRRQQKPTN